MVARPEPVPASDGADPGVSSLRVPEDLDAVVAARDFVVGLVLDWGSDDAEDLAVVTSELVTNAIVHARSAPTVTIRRVADGQVRLEVSDDDPSPPVVRVPYDRHTRGHGLHIVEALSEEWGVEVVGDAKVVWCRIDV